ncbi:hypothetical protein CSKR_107466, partial [Clonorchis sinensis]
MSAHVPINQLIVSAEQAKFDVCNLLVGAIDKLADDGGKLDDGANGYGGKELSVTGRKGCDNELHQYHRSSKRSSGRLTERNGPLHAGSAILFPRIYVIAKSLHAAPHSVPRKPSVALNSAQVSSVLTESDSDASHPNKELQVTFWQKAHGGNQQSVSGSVHIVKQPCALQALYQNTRDYSRNYAGTLFISSENILPRKISVPSKFKG